MKKTNLILGGFFILSVVFGALPLWAQSEVQECKDRIVIIRADLDVVTVGGGNAQKTYDSLKSKLDGALVKLGDGKFPEATQKLVDFGTAVIVLRDAAKPKLSAQDADLLLDGDLTSGDPIDEGANGAIACVALLP